MEFEHDGLKVAILFLVTGPCCRDAWVQLVSVTILRKVICPSRYILAKEEGSERLGSMAASRTSSLIEVLRMLRSLEAGNLAELLTRDRTDLRNSAVFDLTTGVVEELDVEEEEGMRWGKVSRR